MYNSVSNICARRWIASNAAVFSDHEQVDERVRKSFLVSLSLYVYYFAFTSAI